MTTPVWTEPDLLNAGHIVTVAEFNAQVLENLRALARAVGINNANMLEYQNGDVLVSRAEGLRGITLAEGDLIIGSTAGARVLKVGGGTITRDFRNTLTAFPVDGVYFDRAADPDTITIAVGTDQDLLDSLTVGGRIAITGTSFPTTPVNYGITGVTSGTSGAVSTRVVSVEDGEIPALTAVAQDTVLTITFTPTASQRFLTIQNSNVRWLQTGDLINLTGRDVALMMVI